MSDKPYDRPPANLEELTPEVRIEWPKIWPWLMVVLVPCVAFGAWSAGLFTVSDPDKEAIEIPRIELTDRDPLDTENRATWQPLTTSLAEAARAIADAQKQWAEHDRELNELLDSEAGRQLAAAPDRMRRYTELVKQSQPVANGAADASATVAELLQTINTALAGDTPIKPASATMIDSVAAIHRQATSDLEKIRQLRAQLDGLVREATSASTSGPPLREALVALQAQNAAKLSALELADQAQRQRAIDEQAALSRRQEAERAEAARVEAARQAEAAEKHSRRITQLRQELPTMRPYLTPFITPGRMQLGKYGWETSAEPAPLSWAALSKLLGAPGDSRAIATLVNTFGELDTKNDRPYGSFPRRYQPDLDRGTLVRLIEFLQANGNLLVEEGLLRP